MAPPQPPADTKPVKSQDDYINHGRDQLMSFLMTLRAIAIYGIATDWHTEMEYEPSREVGQAVGTRGAE